MYGIIKISDWDEARQIAKKMTRYAFRGQSDSSWPLQSTIERYHNDFTTNGLEYLDNREFWILRQFQRRAHKYIDAPPDIENRLEWLALIQHYGGPTRLLDFTHSFYIASYFAMEKSAGEAAIWAINLSALESNHQKMGNHETIDHVNRRHIQDVEKILLENSQKKYVLNVEPDKLNERISIQQGLFIVPFDITASFIENLAGTFDFDVNIFDDSNAIFLDPAKILNSYASLPAVIKILLPHNIHDDAMRDLKNMNITAATLFPGLEGFSRSLIQHLRM